MKYLAFIFFLCSFAFYPKHTITNSKGAIRIAKIEWNKTFYYKTYEEDTIIAKLIGDSVWVVVSYFKIRKNVITAGGGRGIRLRKIDSKILQINATK